MNIKAITTAAALVWLAVGCAPPQTEAEDATARQSDPSQIAPPPSDDGYTVPKVLNGQPTLERPEIGGFYTGGGFCTGTLIRRNIVITAAHCVDFRSRLTPGNYGRFEITTENGQKHTYPVDMIYSYQEVASERDIALVHLSQDVPTEVARPTTLSEREARPGEQSTIYGYGCTNRNGGGGGQPIKRKFSFSYSSTYNLCPGDSGGPVVIGNDGAIFHINSGYITHSGEDVFGEVFTHRQDLLRQIREWNGTDEPEDNQPEDNEPEPLPGAGVTVTNATGAPLWLHCNGESGPGCSGWTLLQKQESAFIETPDKGFYLYNIGFAAPVSFEMRRVFAQSDEVTIHANAANPLSNDGIDEPDPQASNGVKVTNATGSALYVHCGAAPGPECSDWQLIDDGQAAFIKTPNQRLFLYNARFNPRVVFNLTRINFRTPEITIYANASNPLASPNVSPEIDDRSPVPNGSVQVKNDTGTRLYVHCDGPASATCSDWVLLEHGEMTMLKTDNGGLLLHNTDFNPTVSYHVRQVMTQSDRVTIYANTADPLKAP